MRILNLFGEAFYGRHGRRLFYAALAGFCVSFLAHISTIGELNWNQDPPWILMGLGLGAFVVGVPVTLSEVRFAASPEGKNTPWKRFVAWLSPQARHIITVLLIYGLVNFAAVYLLSGGGVARFENGRYFLQDHGKFTELSRQEYHAYKSYEAKLVTSYFMFFYLIAIYYCRYQLSSKSRQLD